MHKSVAEVILELGDTQKCLSIRSAAKLSHKSANSNEEHFLNKEKKKKSRHGSLAFFS